MFNLKIQIPCESLFYRNVGFQSVHCSFIAGKKELCEWMNLSCNKSQGKLTEYIFR